MQARADYEFRSVKFSNGEKALFARISQVFSVWGRRRHERRMLAGELGAMPDEALRDLGLTRAGALKLVRRPFWRA